MAATSFTFPPVSLEEWGDLPEDDDREFVDGRLVDAEMPSPVHECIIAWLFRVLAPWAESHGARIFGSGLKFGVTEQRGRMPDMSVFLSGRKRPAKPGTSRFPPSIAIEVVSPSATDERRDRVEKMAEYALFGIDWYWLVDPEWRTFEILERGSDGGYRHLIGVSEGLIDPVPGCPDLTIDVTALWRWVDAYLAEAGEEREEQEERQDQQEQE